MNQLSIPFPDNLFNKIKEHYLQSEIKKLEQEKEHLKHQVAGFKGYRTKRLKVKNKMMNTKESEDFKPCGEGDNICNCKKSSECGYLIQEKEKFCATHCDWPNCTLQKCMYKDPEGWANSKPNH